MEATISFRDVRVGFEEGDIVRGLSFEVFPKETLVLLGETGTGKTLSLKMAAGLRRPVSIARALITRPPIVLYDSPTAGLDPVTSQTIITLILRLRDIYGVTALLATHRLQDGFALANFHFDTVTNRVLRNAEKHSDKMFDGESSTRFAVLRDGKVFFEGSPEEISTVKDPYLKRFLE